MGASDIISLVGSTMSSVLFPTGGGAVPAVLSAVTTTIGETVGDVLPFAIGIMAILIGVSLIPRLVYKFL